MAIKDPAVLAAEAIKLVPGANAEEVAEIIRDHCDTTAPMWIERAAERLGCDPFGPSIVKAIGSLLAERERQRQAIANLRGRMAVIRRRESVPSGQDVLAENET